MTEHDYILTQNTRILMPTEWEALREAILTDYQRDRIAEHTESGNTAKANHIQRYQLICDAKLQTGMREVEFVALKREWYRAPRRVVVIPKGAHGKEKSKSWTGRTVMLSLPGCDAVDRYLNSGITMDMTPKAQRMALQRYASKADIGTEGICPKMFRKTLASWLMACYPEQEMYISASMGHDRETLQRHYLGLGFPAKEVGLMMNKYLVEWGRRL